MRHTVGMKFKTRKINPSELRSRWGSCGVSYNPDYSLVSWTPFKQFWQDFFPNSGAVAGYVFSWMLLYILGFFCSGLWSCHA
jgi:hypothetical protein